MDSLTMDFPMETSTVWMEAMVLNHSLQFTIHCDLCIAETSLFRITDTEVMSYIMAKSAQISLRKWTISCTGVKLCHSQKVSAVSIHSTIFKGFSALNLETHGILRLERVPSALFVQKTPPYYGQSNVVPWCPQLRGLRNWDWKQQETVIQLSHGGALSASQRQFNEALVQPVSQL